MSLKLLQQCFIATICACAFVGCATSNAASAPKATTTVVSVPVDETITIKVEKFEDQPVAKDSAMEELEAKKAKLEEERLKKAEEDAKKENELKAKLAAAAQKRAQKKTLTPEEMAAEKTEKLRKIVRDLVAKGEYEKAREVIWRFSQGTLNEEANKILKGVRKDLIMQEVNAPHWIVLEKEILAKVRPMIQAKDYAGVRAYLDTVKPIRTYTKLFDESVDGVATALVTMGVDKNSLEPVCEKTRLAIAAVFALDGEVYSVESEMSLKDGTEYQKAIKALWETLVKYDCSKDDANKIIENFRKSLAELIKKYCVGEETSSSLFALGTTQFNVKLEKLRKDILAQVEVGEFALLLEQYEIALRDGDLEKAMELAKSIDYKKNKEAIDKAAAEAKAKAEKELAEQNAKKEADAKKERVDFYSPIAEALLAKGEYDEATRIALLAKNNVLVDKIATEQVKAYVKSLIERVQACIAKSDWNGARAAIRDEARQNKKALDLKLYSVRLGLLNSLVNPAQCEVILVDMQKKFDAYMAKKDFEGCTEWLKNLPFVVDEYAKIADSLVDIAKEMEKLGMAPAVATDEIDRTKAEILTFLDKRNGKFVDETVRDYKEMVKKLATFESALVDQTMDEPEAKANSEKLLKFAKQWFNREYASLTTYDMNEKIRLAGAEMDVKLQAAIAKAKLEAELAAEKARIEAEKAARLALVEQMDREVGFSTQISIGEEAIRRGLYLNEQGCPLPALEDGFHPVLGDYVRAFRHLQAKRELTAEQKQTILVAGAWLNQPAVVEWALKLGANVDGIAKRDAMKRPALLAAIRAGNLEIVRALIKADAKLSVADAKKNTALHYAARLGSLDLINIVIKENNVNAINDEGRTAIFAPAELNRVPQLKALIEAGANASAVDGNKIDVFTAAYLTKSMLALEALVDAGVQLNINTLKCAAKNDELSIVQWFVSKGVDVNADGVMAAAAEARNAGKPATYNYLVRQGGIPVAMPVVEPEASKCKKCEGAAKAEGAERAEKLAKYEVKGEVANNAPEFLRSVIKKSVETTMQEVAETIVKETITKEEK